MTTLVSTVGSGGVRTGLLTSRNRKAAHDVVDRANKTNVDTSNFRHNLFLKYTIITTESLHQAKAITELGTEPSLRLSASVRAVIKGAIEARQRCSEWFQKSQVDGRGSDGEHT